MWKYVMATSPSLGGMELAMFHSSWLLAPIFMETQRSTIAKDPEGDVKQHIES